MKKYLCLFVSVLIFAQNVSAQGRRYIKDAIEEWGSCRNVAITMTGGDIALNQTNAYSYNGIPTSLANAIDELHADGEYIDDIQLTENGSWIILYGDNGLRWEGIPYDLEQQLRKDNREREVITQIMLNDYGAWIVVTQNHITASDTDIYEWIEDGMSEYGQLWAGHLTNDGLVLCYESGYKFKGNVPDNLVSKLRSTDIDVYRIKFLSDGTYFIADKSGRYSYYM